MIFNAIISFILLCLFFYFPTPLETGDARNDSPGFCTQYCTYTLMEHESKDIVDVQFLDKKETENSGAMEPLAMMRALDGLKAGGITISEPVTDAYQTISAK